MTTCASKTRVVLWIVLGLVLVSVGFSTVYRAAWDDVQRTDYTVYTAAGQAVLDGTDIYDAHNARGWNYVYPPPFALLMVPLAKMSGTLGSLLWFLLEVASIASASIMSVAMLGRAVEARHKDLLYSLPLFSLCTLLVSGVMRCQASEFMFAFIIATFYWHFRGRPVAAGLSLAVAAMLKVFPIVLIGFFVVRRQWRAVLATVAGLVLLGALIPSLFWGWQGNVQRIERWVEVIGKPAMMSNADRARATPVYEQLLDTRKSRNQSLESLALTLGTPPAAAAPVVAGVGLSMLLVMLLAAGRRPSRGVELALASTFVVWSLLISPISETHYFGALIMPLTTLLGVLLYGHLEPHQKRLAVAGLGGLMILVMVLIGWERTENLRPLCIATLLIWGALVRYMYLERAALTSMVDQSRHGKKEIAT